MLRFACTILGEVEYSSDSEWTKKKEPVSCSFAKEDTEKYGFQADKIFDLLLQEGQIKLSPNHTISTVEELKNRKYCKWHNVVSHNTNECNVFRQQIQSAIKQGMIKFENPAKPMKIDGHPFPTNMVKVGDPGKKGKAKMLTSEKAKRSRAVDPEVQISADELKDPSRHEQGQSPRGPRRTVTSNMLINKYWCRQDRERRFQEERS
jgi:hypothetical protein